MFCFLSSWSWSRCVVFTGGCFESRNESEPVHTRVFIWSRWIVCPDRDSSVTHSVSCRLLLWKYPPHSSATKVPSSLSIKRLYFKQIVTFCVCRLCAKCSEKKKKKKKLGVTFKNVLLLKKNKVNAVINKPWMCLEPCCCFWSRLLICGQFPETLFRLLYHILMLFWMNSSAHH